MAQIEVQDLIPDMTLNKTFLNYMTRRMGGKVKKRHTRPDTRAYQFGVQVLAEFRVACIGFSR